MRRHVLLAAMVGVSLARCVLAQDAPAEPDQQAQPAKQQAPQADVPVKVVILYASGVGYFEHFGTVKEDASTLLRFKTQQINDILKSLVLQDMDGGKVSSITYPSQDPLAKTLRSFQVDLAANPSLADLLNQLRGASVTIALNDEEVKGKILGVQKRPKAVGETQIEIAVINIVTGGTIRSIELDQVRKIELDDQQLQAELSKALEAIAQARDQETKPVIINFAGKGERHVRIGYVVETPIWKSSYRLVMSEPGKEPGGMLQGWAIVENQTDTDWNDVQLSLVSGRPISFIQDLYQPLYVPRPVVQPELYASLRPQTYEAGMDKEGAKMQQAMEEAEQQRDEKATLRENRRTMAKTGNAAPQAADAGLRAGGGGQGDAFFAEAIDPTASVASIASAAKVGELFQYTVGNVTLPRQKSAMIPIITDPVSVERLSIYNAQTLPRNPLNGARLKNTTDKHLLAGPITVFDQNTYAGDARVDNVPPGQERLLSYGIDLKMLVDSTAQTNTSTIQTAKVVKGVMHIQRKNVFTQTYVAQNKGDLEKTLIIEHPIRPGWKLIEPEKPIETTDQLYRFSLKVPAGGEPAKLTVKEEIVQGEALAIFPADVGQLMAYARTGEIPQDVRDVLAKAIQFKQAMVDTQRQIQERQQRIAEITQGQVRIRENMKVAEGKGDKLYSRLLTKLDEEETKLEKLDSEIKELQTKFESQRKELEDYLANITVG